MNTTKTLRIVITLLFLSGLISAIATEHPREKEQNSPETQSAIFECSPSLNFIANIPEYTLPSQPFVISRKNAGSLTGTSQTIKSFRKGIELMKTLGPQDKRNWDNFIKIHGKQDGSAFHPLHNTGVNTHLSQFFLSWHRMYLYFFERIIIKLTNDPNFRIPYWDPVSNRYVPAYMTASTYSSSGISKTNPLNNLTRERNYFTKAQFKLFKSSVNDALKPDQPYCTFLETLRSGAHNLMHANIGGELKNQNISSKDPLFFMLHANIDRLWERWITFDNQYPANSEFLNQYFFFIDENGNTVKMRGIQILQTTQQLGYKYSSPGNVNPGSRPQNKCCPTNQPGSRQMLLEQPQAYTTQNQKTKISLSASAISNVDQVINIIKNLNFNQQVYLEIEGINISRLPSPAIYVYLTKTNKLDKKPRLSSFVGALDLSPLSFEGSNPTITARVNVKRLLPALVYSISDLKNLGLILQVEDDKPFTLNFSNIRLVIEER